MAADRNGPPPGLRGDVGNGLRGFLMGGADIIPGVSGGTVALILGIYERLVTAISRFDARLIQLLLGREWRAAAQYVDFRFLTSLGIGIGAGIVSLAGLMHYLLLNHHRATLAAFFGLIAASSWLVAKLVRTWRAAEVAAGIGGAVFAFWLVGLPLLTNPPDSTLYLFFCGMIAICAMILPGISGAFILVLLGKYAEVTGLVKGLVHGEISGAILLSLITFGLGCVIGLIGFSKLLKYLLARYESITMALLGGFMLGSLRKLWPFQTDLTPDIHELKHKLYEMRPLSEVSVTNELLPALLVVVLAAGLVLSLDYWAGRSRLANSLDDGMHEQTPAPDK